MNHSTVISQVHAAVPGRIRYSIPELRSRASLAQMFERRLRRAPGVHDVRSNPRTATLLVFFDSAQPSAGWQNVLADLLDVPVRALDQAPARQPVSAFEKRGEETAERAFVVLGTLRRQLAAAWHSARSRVSAPPPPRERTVDA
jgi:hypothetical protein